jgi:hypothetical protein
MDNCSDLVSKDKLCEQFFQKVYDALNYRRGDAALDAHGSLNAWNNVQAIDFPHQLWRENRSGGKVHSSGSITSSTINVGPSCSRHDVKKNIQIPKSY